MKSALAPVLVSILTLSNPCAQQDNAAPPSPTEFVIETGDHELREVIERAAEFLGRNILINAQDFAAQAGTLEVRISKRIEVDSVGCWEVLCSLLYLKGFAVVPLDADKGLFEVISMHGPRRSELSSGARFVPLADVGRYANQRATPIITLYPLTHVNATVATNALRPFFAPSGGGAAGLTLGNVGNQSSILLQGMGTQVQAAVQLLKLADNPAPEPALESRVVRLEHARADEVATTVRQVMIGRATQMAAAQGAMGGMPPLPFEVVAHAPLNAVVLSGVADRLRVALDLIAQLDAPAVEGAPQRDVLLERLETLEQRVRELEGVPSKDR